jgi:hypothetical protein
MWWERGYYPCLDKMVELFLWNVALVGLDGIDGRNILVEQSVC